MSFVTDLLDQQTLQKRSIATRQNPPFHNLLMCCASASRCCGKVKQPMESPVRVCFHKFADLLQDCTGCCPNALAHPSSGQSPIKITAAPFTHNPIFFICIRLTPPTLHLAGGHLFLNPICPYLYTAPITLTHTPLFLSLHAPPAGGHLPAPQQLGFSNPKT